MHLNVPSFVTRQGVTLTNAYAYNAGLYFDQTVGSGRVVLNVHPSQAVFEQGYPPADQLDLSFGEILVAADPNATPPVAEVKASTLPELLSHQAVGYQAATPPTGADAYTVLMLLILQEWLKHPRLSGAAIVAD